MIICKFCAGLIKWAFFAALASFALVCMSFVTGSIIILPFLAIADFMFGFKVTFQQGMGVPGPKSYNFPLEEWEAFIKETQGEEGKHGDFELKDVTLKYPTPKRYEKVKESHGVDVAEWFKESVHFRIGLYWKNKLICRMWPVTWRYISARMVKEVNSKTK